MKIRIANLIIAFVLLLPLGFVSAPTPAKAMGQNKLLVIMMNFQDLTTQPYTADQLRSSAFSSPKGVDPFFKDTSFGKDSFPTIDIVGWYTLPVNGANCANQSQWIPAANTAATNAGVVLSNYTHFGYFFPYMSACNASGWANVGGTSHHVYINGTLSAKVWEHELGHNEGDWHSSSRSCGTVSIAPLANCTVSEYGNPYDTMGTGSGLQFNGPQKILPGYLPSANLKTVTVNGTYTIDIAETASVNAQVLKIAKPDTAEGYYLDYRQTVGFDAGLPAGITRGVSVELWKGSGNTYLLDTTPGSTGGFSDSSLADGASFVDSANGITVTQVSHTPTSATVSVTFGTASCIRSAPTLTLSPVTQTVAAGAKAQYYFTIRNNNSVACSAATYNFTPTVPTGWTSYAQSGNTAIGDTITLNSGLSMTNASWQVTAPAGTVDGIYPLSLKITDAFDTTLSAASSANQTLFADSAAPTVTITAPTNASTVSGSNYTLTATATDNYGVAKVEFYVDGKSMGTDSSSPYSYRWSLRKMARGSHSIVAKAYDGAGNVGTSSTVTVTY